MPFTVWFPVLTLLAGFFSKALFDWLEHSRTFAREKAARQEARRQQLADRRRALQRATLIELQQATLDLCRSAGVIHHQNVVAFHRTGNWQQQRLGESLDEQSRVLQAQTAILRARIQDQQVRDLVVMFKSSVGDIYVANSPEQSQASMADAVHFVETLNGRIGEVLRTLDDDEVAST